jgi:hypothetical protein
VVPKKIAIAAAESCPGLNAWTEALFGAARNNGLAPPPIRRQGSTSSQLSGVDEARRRDLLKILLGVYMRDE